MRDIKSIKMFPRDGENVMNSLMTKIVSVYGEILVDPNTKKNFYIKYSVEKSKHRFRVLTIKNIPISMASQPLST